LTRRAEVLLHGERVGTLSEGVDGRGEFRFNDEYRRQLPRPILGQRFEDYELDRTWRAPPGERLPDFFANLVPEGRLRELIEETAGIRAGDDLALLTFVGEDLPGAVAVRALSDELPEPLSERHPKPDASPLPDEESLRFSLAGVQLKFSMLRREEKLVLPMKGETGEWIVKFPSPRFPHLPENEFAVMEWARRCGFDVPDCHLYDAERLEGYPRRFLAEGRVVAIRRYDRTRTGRVHQEDLNQVVGQPPADKYKNMTYEKLAGLVRGVLGDDGAREMVRRLAFMVASGNGDAHLKNWSFLYSDGIHAAWSPLYDQVATVAWPEVGTEMSFKLAGVRDFGGIDSGTFPRLAERAGLPRETVLETVEATLRQSREAWPLAGEALPAPHRQAVLDHWRRVPLLVEMGSLE